LKTTATGRGHRLLPLRRDDLQLTTHYYAVALHAVRRYSATGAVGASDGGRHDDPITVAADHERMTVPPPPTTVPPTDKAAVDVTEEKSTSIIRYGTATTTYYYYLLHLLLLLLPLLPRLLLLLLLLYLLIILLTTGTTTRPTYSITTTTDRAVVDVTEVKSTSIIPDAAALTHKLPVLTRDALPVLDGTTIDALFEGKKSIEHKQ
jgi:hypothetical protein